MGGQKWPFWRPFLAAHLPTVLPLTSAFTPTHPPPDLIGGLAGTFVPLYSSPFLNPSPWLPKLRVIKGTENGSPKNRAI
jgi:hypothetical protein